MFLAVADLIRRAPVIYALIATLDNCVLIAGCVFLAVSLFHLSLQKTKAPYLICAALCVLLGAFAPAFQNPSYTAGLLWSTVMLASPFVCMAILFQKHSRLKAMLTAAGYTFALVRFFRMRQQADNYKKQLQMQIRQFEWMEQMYEDVRMFRHDFPKKMRPLLTYAGAVERDLYLL